MTLLETLKKLNGERTLETNDGHLCITRLLSGHYDQADADWIAAMSNNATALLELVEAANGWQKAVSDPHSDSSDVMNCAFKIIDALRPFTEERG